VLQLAERTGIDAVTLAAGIANSTASSAVSVTVTLSIRDGVPASEHTLWLADVSPSLQR
jgi:hypothetical protein